MIQNCFKRVVMKRFGEMRMIFVITACLFDAFKFDGKNVVDLFEHHKMSSSFGSSSSMKPAVGG